MTAYRRMSVPLADGELTAGVWGSGNRAVLAVHGVTSSHQAWRLVAERLPEDTLLIAPDLRGRGDSAALPGPYGMARHADDCAAVLDALGCADAVVAGHSMGGFVALVLADRHPQRVQRLILVDGGPPLPLPPGETPEEQLAAVIGPAAARLTMRFHDREAYRDHWRAHPAFADWSPAVEAYVDYDLTGEPGDLRSKASADAVRDDSVDLHTGRAAAGAWSRLRHEVQFLRAEFGMLGALPALYPDPAPIAARMPVRTVDGSNHYTILLGTDGADSVAATL
ncbi:alpha/beta hydrolase [Streptomyces sp. NPDC004680]|uniref:alpha/beta fold hydrolase n=1 Tax=Streptomyces sp. NPDC004680 TaxID=3154287 RepID=UPI0033A583BB